MALLDMVGDDAYHVERVRKRDDERAIALLRAHEDKSYSLCDALSFVVMERLRFSRGSPAASSRRAPHELQKRAPGRVLING